MIYWIIAALALLLAAAALGIWMQKKRVKRSEALRMAARMLACAGVICGAVSVIVGINDRGASTKKPLPTEEPALTASGEMGETAADAAAPIDAEAAGGYRSFGGYGCASGVCSGRDRSAAAHRRDGI